MSDSERPKRPDPSSNQSGKARPEPAPPGPPDRPPAPIVHRPDLLVDLEKGLDPLEVGHSRLRRIALRARDRCTVRILRFWRGREGGMSTRFKQTSETERRIAAELRTRVLDTIEREGLTEAMLAERLGLLRVGVRLLLEREAWPLDVTVRVAETVGIKVELRAKPASA